MSLRIKTVCMKQAKATSGLSALRFAPGGILTCSIQCFAQLFVDEALHRVSGGRCVLRGANAPFRIGRESA